MILVAYVLEALPLPPMVLALPLLQGLSLWLKVQLQHWEVLPEMLAFASQVDSPPSLALELVVARAGSLKSLLLYLAPKIPLAMMASQLCRLFLGHRFVDQESPMSIQSCPSSLTSRKENWNQGQVVQGMLLLGNDFAKESG